MAHAHLPHDVPAGWPLDWIVIWAMIAAVAVGYALAVHYAHPSTAPRRWPWERSAAWYGGLMVVGLSLTGPIATRADTDLTAHMVAHLLAGMLGPLLLVYGAPVNLALRALPTRRARTLSRGLRSRPVHGLTQPFVAGAIVVGGLALLYLTGFYAYTMDHAAAHAAAHTHLVLAGYLFTHSVVGIDPGARRSSYTTRIAALVCVAAAHGMVAKTLYAHPPTGVPIDIGQRAAMVMYYGGDVADAILAVLVCRQWYTTTRPRSDTVLRNSAVSSGHRALERRLGRTR